MKKNIDELNSVWDDQYRYNDDTALKDNNLFELEFDAIFSVISDNLNLNKKIRILEIGCGTGFLINKIKNKLNTKIFCDCVDFSQQAIEIAKRRNILDVNFYCEDFFKFFKKNNETYDFIISQRSIMAIMSRSQQTKLLKHIKNSLKRTGVGILSECFEEQLIKLNKHRKIMGLRVFEKVWHSLYLKTSQINNIFTKARYIDFCSTYFLVTRIIYPFFDDPIHNQEIHKKAMKLTNSGDYSFLRLVVVKIN